ncbi:hypothetical protein HR45_06155 [Shewanella mangrovi]|uniref:Uncharacterized protein n=1 Tax=Shewanella mangrovi TaxID=1515746 RepID=A0A094JFQ8_9GAMM|nr:hypothetical protein [Shewanella mangrovi]KFZ38087.1 hypothetical protein HR45_06155 [Shewanella mangrovi]
MKSSRLLTSVCCLFTSNFIFSAHAAEPSGMVTSIYFLMLLGGFTLCNIPLQALFYFNGQYCSTRFPLWHTAIALIVNIVGAVLVIDQQPSTAYLSMYLGIIIVAIALALLPMWLRQSAKPQSQHASRNLLIGAVIFGLVSLLAWPVAIFSAALAIVAKQQNSEQQGVINGVCWLVALATIIWFGYQASMLWQHIPAN